ncbi:ferritin-like domain-containing protein [Chitinimonas sp.]|uniref:ferritin-like domain-containing protein n=1 Tax=Chitinimonas sp. TaxID=1934313 RepID=UPI002F94E3AD
MTPASHRDQLNGMLCEAAEIEHTLMCTYLYAAFSLKQSTAEDLTEAELAAVRRWRREIIAVAVDEMLHLALVNNLIAALGERPHYRRFNFPISSGPFPADVAVALAPFDRETLEHFVYLERPQNAKEKDGSHYEKGQYKRGSGQGRLMQFAEDYDTVGMLYHSILHSFRNLVDRLGEATVLVGHPDTQLTQKEYALEGLLPIQTLADVEQAIHRIVSQGEGSSESTAGSHYARFCAIRSEWDALSAARPGFAPGRNVAHNPIMRPQVVPGNRVHIVAEPAATLLDTGNALYGLMLRLLGLMNDPWLAHRGIRPTVARQTLALMHAVTEIGTALTQLPANPAHPGIQAGLTFTVSRAALSFVAPTNACAVLAERCAAISERLLVLGSSQPALAHLGLTLRDMAATWAQWQAGLLAECAAAGATAHVAILLAQPVVTPPAASVAPSPAPSGGKVDVAVGEAATVRFDHGRCIHSRQCVMGEPEVFVANKPGEWIYPQAASVERLIRIAIACPSGAITVERHDGGEAECAPLVNQARVRENGPLAVHAELHIAGRADGYRATLCRCGLSRNKPFCDGSHVEGGFVATGEPATRQSDPLPQRNGPLRVDPLRNGPLSVSGNLEVLSGTGRTVERLSQVRLCRCGQSRNKPYCDNSHIEAGFEADGV